MQKLRVKIVVRPVEVKKPVQEMKNDWELVYFIVG